MSHGWEWPAPGEPTCGAEAEDRATGERLACNLALGHRSHEHHWQTPPKEGQIRSATWCATGPLTFIGRAVS